MKTKSLSRILAAAAVLLALSLPARAEYRAVVIGVDKYREPGRNLTGCVNDAGAFAAALQRHYGIPASAIAMVTDERATKAAVMKAIEDQLITPSKPGDTLIFYCASHGDITQDFDGDEEDQFDEALIASDGDPKNPGTWITDDEIARLFSRAQTPHVFMVFDTCHSGTLFRGVSGLANTRGWGFGNRRALPANGAKAADKFAASLNRSFPNHVILMACDATEEANEIRGADWDLIGKPGHKDGGLFTSALLELLETSPDATLSDLLDKVRQQTAVWIEKLGKKSQTPQFEIPRSGFKLASYIRGAELIVDTPSEPPPPAPAVTIAPDGVITSGAIKLGLKTNGRIFQKGDLLKVEVTSDQDAFIRVYYLSADNKVLQIFPNKQHKDNFIRGGTTVSIPGQGATFKFRMRDPFGNEVLKVVASSTQFTDLEDEKWAEELFKSYLETDLQSMRVRGIEVEETARQFGEAVLIYTVKDPADPAAR